MSIEKPLEPLVPTQMDIEIEVEPETGETEVEIEIKPVTFEANLLEELDARAIQTISAELLDTIRTDLNSRSDWEKTYSDGMKLLGLKIDQRTEPWNGACGVFHPMLSEAVVKFQSEMVLSTFPASGPVKTQIVGKMTREKEEAANRVQDDMNYRLTQEVPNTGLSMKDFFGRFPSRDRASRRFTSIPT